MNKMKKYMYLLLMFSVLFFSITLINAFDWDAAELKSYYNFEEGSGTKLIDVYQGNVNGTISGSPSWKTGKLGSSIYCDGINDYINLGNNFKYTEYSWNFWINVNKSKEFKVIGADTTGSNNDVIFQTDSLGTSLQLAWNGFLGESETITNNETYVRYNWTMVTINVNSSGTTLYVNNVSVNSSSVYFNISDNTLDFMMCNRQALESTMFFDGYLDEVAIFNKTLNNSQINELYNSGSGLEFEYINPPSSFLISPIDPYSTNSNLTTFICNQTDLLFSDDNTDLLKNNTLVIWNSTNSIIHQNTTVISGTTNQTTNLFSLPYDNVFKWNCYVCDNSSSCNYDTTNYTLIFDTQAPSINLLSPDNEQYFNRTTGIYFNFTSVFSLGIDTAELWINSTGLWAKNFTWIHPNNNTMNWTTLDITADGRYVWNVRVNNSLGTFAFSEFNRTLIIDTITPQANNITVSTTANSQTFTFLSNITDTNLQSCKFSIYNLAGGIDGSNENVSFQCNNLTSATVSSFATFIIKTYGIDFAGFENSTNKTFIISQSTAVIQNTGGGGSDNPPVTIISQTGIYNWTMETDSKTGGYNLNMIQKSSRMKPVVFTSQGSSEVNLILSCESLNDSLDYENLCQYITIERKELTLPLSNTIITSVDVTINIPREIEKGKYAANIVAVDQEKNRGSITYIVNIGSFNFLVELGVKLTSSLIVRNVSFPYFIIFLFIVAILWATTFYLYLNKLVFGAGLSLILSIIVASIVILLL